MVDYPLRRRSPTRKLTKIKMSTEMVMKKYRLSPSWIKSKVAVITRDIGVRMRISVASKMIEPPNELSPFVRNNTNPTTITTMLEIIPILRTNPILSYR